MSTKSLFITGGSGYIGSTVIKEALAQGYTVTALSRRESSDDHLRFLGATPVRGDLKAHDVLTREASKASVVINIADSISDSFASDSGKMPPEDRFRVNNGGIAALAEGLKGSGKPLILTSGSLTAMTDPDGKETNEDSPGWPEGHPFHQSHEAANLAYKDDGIRVCYVCLAPYVYGNGGSGVKLFLQNYLRAGAGMYIDDGKARITTVHVEDAARLYLLLAENPKAEGKYNATDETHVTQGQLAEAICELLDLPCRAMSFQVASEKMGPWFATFLKSENRASNRKAREELGWVVKAERGILNDVKEGSYVQLRDELRKKKEGVA
jgi:nucleoside-diphosphate-sugar epimerase